MHNLHDSVFDKAMSSTEMIISKIMWAREFSWQKSQLNLIILAEFYAEYKHWYQKIFLFVLCIDSSKSNVQNKNACNDIIPIELINAKYYWIAKIPDIRHSKEVIILHSLWINKYICGNSVHYLIGENMYKLLVCHLCKQCNTKINLKELHNSFYKVHKIILSTQKPSDKG